MTHFDGDAGRTAAEADALLALIDAELPVDDATHKATYRPSDEELLAIARRAFNEANTIVEAEDLARSAQVVGEDLNDILASWSAELGLSSVTRRATHPAEKRRAWKVRITDRVFLAGLLGVDRDAALSVAVSEAPVEDGISVSVEMPLNRAPSAGVEIVALLEYGDGVQARVPLHRRNLGDAATRSGAAELTGSAFLSGTAPFTHPRLTVYTVRRPS
jgi:hypothetical protein